MKVIPLHHHEKSLVKKALKQDRKAQQLIFELYAPKMLSVCRMYVRDLHFAEDVMLKGFLKVFTRLSTYKKEGSFEGWIRKIMVREAIDFLRGKQQFYFSEHLENQALLASEDVFSAKEAVDELQQYIDELPKGYQLVFIMYAVEGYPHQEIADLLQISVGTSKSQLCKARKLLQEKLKEKRKRSHGNA